MSRNINVSLYLTCLHSERKYRNNCWFYLQCSTDSYVIITLRSSNLHRASLGAKCYLTVVWGLKLSDVTEMSGVFPKCSMSVTVAWLRHTLSNLLEKSTLFSVCGRAHGDFLYIQRCTGPKKHYLMAIHQQLLYTSMFNYTTIVLYRV